MRSISAIIFLLLAAILLPGGVRAQSLMDNLPIERPDIDSIYNEITDRTSPFYYPRLMEEFERNDTVMKLDKYRRLYLGAMLAEDYDAYRPSAYHASDPSALLNHAMPTRDECDTIIKYTSAALADNPFDLVQMINLSRALRARGRTALADVWNYKVRMLLTAILSTGTGADEENAWFVIEPQHEYILLNALGLTAKNHIFIEPCYEYISVTDPSGRNLGGFYFNIATPLEEYWRKHPQE